MARQREDGAICNDFEQRIAYEAYKEAMASLDWSPPSYESDSDLPQADHVRINDMGAVIRAEGDAPKLHTMRWSFPPSGPKGGPVFNFRSEGRQFSVGQRCLIPASAFFEFTTPADPKQKRKDRWRFMRKDGQWMAIAGLWRPATGNVPGVFTMLTCEPGPDVAPIHKRRIVVVEPEHWKAWLYQEDVESEVLKPSAERTLLFAAG